MSCISSNESVNVLSAYLNKKQIEPFGILPLICTLYLIVVFIVKFKKENFLHNKETFSVICVINLFFSGKQIFTNSSNQRITNDQAIKRDRRSL